MTERQLTPQQSFEQKIADRLRKDIGDLMPDDVLKDQVSRATEEAFSDEVMKLVEKQLGLGVTGMVAKTIDGMFNQKLWELQSNMQQKLTNLVNG